MVYKIPDYTDDTLTKKTRLIRWTTHREDSGIRRYPDGKYDLLVKAWDANGDPVILNSSHPENNRLTVMIDNTWPEALLTRIGPHNILRTDELLPYTPVCPTLIKGKYCEIIFDATDAKGHLLNYRLSLITGHNFCVDETIKEYDGKSSTGADEVFKVTKKHKAAGTGAVTTTHPRDDVKPPGGFPDEAVVWDTGSPDVVPCAYQVRLRVWDRVIDGYEFIHWTEDTMHFTVEP
jgi:hypothetical protein